MAKKNNKSKNLSTLNQTDSTKSNHFSEFLSKYFIWICLFIALVISLLTFDIKPSIGGDDSSYIYRANEFVKNFTYPGGYQTPLYPIVLSVFIFIFGFHVVFLKSLSVIFMIGAIYFFFKAFENEVSQSILLLTIFVFSTNVSILYYSSQTYSESFFMMIQSVLVWMLMKKNPSESNTASIWLSVKSLLLISFVSFLLYATRSAGLFIIGGVAAYFLFSKQMKYFFIYIGTTGIFLVLFKLFEKFVLGIDSSSQLNLFLLINSYQPNLGTESISGFLGRFVDNIFTYLGQTFYEISFSIKEGVFSGSTGLFVLTLILIALGKFWSFKQKSKLFLISSMSSVFLLAVSFLLQHYWLNARLIITIYPFLLLIIFYGIEQTYKNWLPSWKTGFVFLSFAILIAFSYNSVSKIKEPYSTLKHNLSGDKLYGYTPDWQNFLKVCEWSAKNLPDTVKIANRKETIYYLYSGGRRGYNIASASLTNADDILSMLKKSGVTHLIYDNFTWSGTVRKFIQPVAEKYPEKLKVIHQEGSKDSYPSYLIELQY